MMNQTKRTRERGTYENCEEKGRNRMKGREDKKRQGRILAEEDQTTQRRGGEEAMFERVEAGKQI